MRTPAETAARKPKPTRCVKESTAGSIVLYRGPSADGGKSRGKFTDSQPACRSLAISSQRSTERATERNAGEETAQHDAEGKDTASQNVTEHARPQHFMQERDCAREKHQWQYPCWRSTCP